MATFNHISIRPTSLVSNGRINAEQRSLEVIRFASKHFEPSTFVHRAVSPARYSQIGISIAIEIQNAIRTANIRRVALLIASMRYSQMSPKYKNSGIRPQLSFCYLLHGFIKYYVVPALLLYGGFVQGHSVRFCNFANIKSNLRHSTNSKNTYFMKHIHHLFCCNKDKVQVKQYFFVLL